MLKPSFASDAHDLRSTFNLLGNVIRLLVVLAVIWAVAAGFLQTARLIQYIPKGLPNQGTGFWATQTGWLAPLVGVPVYAAKAFAAAMLTGLAAATIGGFLGFLFGVPRPEIVAGAAATIPAQPTTAPGGGTAATASAIPGAAAAALQPGRGWQSSTNLTEISDWLTKIIVGVGLIEAKSIFDGLSRLSYTLGGMLFDGELGTRLVFPSIMIASAIVGFLYGYLFTQLRVAALLARTDAELRNAGANVATILPRGIQVRKERFSDYIQGLVEQNDTAPLDAIAQALGIPIESDLRAKRRSILNEVGTRVDIADDVVAENAMTNLSDLLRNATGGRVF